MLTRHSISSSHFSPITRKVFAHSTGGGTNSFGASWAALGIATARSIKRAEPDEDVEIGEIANTAVQVRARQQVGVNLLSERLLPRHLPLISAKQRRGERRVHFPGETPGEFLLLRWGLGNQQQRHSEKCGEPCPRVAILRGNTATPTIHMSMRGVHQFVLTVTDRTGVATTVTVGSRQAASHEVH